jgi:hypothetical protein
MSDAKTAAWVVLAGSSLAFALALRADPAAAPIPFPDGYRRWVHVKTTLIGREAPSYDRNGGIHHFYANELAVEGYRIGRFPDASVLVDDGLEAKESQGVTSDGPRKRVAVMMKDARRFASTGGWGFEVFKGDGREAGLTDEGRATCFACHSKASHDSVWTELLP